MSLFDPSGHRVVSKPTLPGDRLAACLEPDAVPRATCTQLQGGLDGFILDHVLTARECTALRATAEELGYSFWDPERRREDFRSAETVEVDCVPLAECLWKRIQAFVRKDLVLDANEARSDRETVGQWRVTGVNSNMLFARYKECGHFSPHRDGYTITDFNTRSLYTIIVYLNDCTSGGETNMLMVPDSKRNGHEDDFVKDDFGRFMGKPEQIVDTCRVQAGRVLIFHQDYVHEGVRVGSGMEKHIIRTDVMYTRTGDDRADTADDLEAWNVLQRANKLEADGDFQGTVRLLKQIPRKSVKIADRYGL